MGHSPNQSAQAATVTSGINGEALFTFATEHTLFKGAPVVIAGTAPGNFTDGTTYFVVGDNNFASNAFALAATDGGAPIAFSSAGSSVTVGIASGTYRVIRSEHVVTEQWITGASSAANAKSIAKDPTQNNQNKFWKRRRVYQLANPYEDTFEYVVSAADDGT